MFGPIAHFRENSAFYSGKAPVRMTGVLPQITIMMPVYKVSNSAVLPKQATLRPAPIPTHAVLSDGRKGLKA